MTIENQNLDFVSSVKEDGIGLEVVDFSNNGEFPIHTGGCFGTAGSFGTATGCAGTFGTYGCFGSSFETATNGSI